MAAGGPTIAAVQFAKAWLDAEETAGRRFGPILLALAVSRWRSEMDHDPDLRRYGTLRYVLEEIRKGLFSYPAEARERATVVVDYVEKVTAPIAHYYFYLVGLAWKEYANALRYNGCYSDALTAAERSRTAFQRVGSLECDAAKARLVEALVRRELGELTTVQTIAKACGTVFREYGDAEAFMHAQMTLALVLSDTRQYPEAMKVLAETGKDAARRGDKRTLAICLHNSADCARALGNLRQARQLDARALQLFEELGSSVEKPYIRWNEAKALAAEGRHGAAILQFYVARNEFLTLGMNGCAADCGLDIVRLRFDLGEDVATDCVELIETMTSAGMVQSAIEALAYLRAQATVKAVSSNDIDKVQRFIRDADRNPAQRFLAPTVPHGIEA